ncbi:MAG: biopolymer transporter ExbD [Oligoflexia bacterium]|nr:biopolymer transporter ExbD [Oligoflexia bacterium]
MTGSNDISSRTTLSEINVTPLVDVMLVLLIIFMVTAPMMQQGLDVELPEAANSGLTVTDEPFVLVVKKDESIWAGSANIALNSLRTKMGAIMETRTNKQIYIQADKDASYGFVAQIIGELKAAGIHSIGLVTLPLDKK